MTNLYFLAGKWEILRMILGSMVAVAESLGNPASTVIIGFIFKDVQKLISGERTLSEFMNKIQVYTYCLVAITGYTAVTSALGYILWMGVGFELGHKARSRLYRALIQRSSGWFDESANLNGRAMMYYKDIQDLEVAAGTASFEIVSMFVGCIVEIAIAFYFSWSVTLVCLAGVPLLLLIGSLCSKPITAKVTTSKQMLDSISGTTNWVLNSLQTVKIFQREKYEHLKISKGFESLRKINTVYRTLFCMQEGLCRTVVLMIFMQGFYFGSYMVRHHGLNAGSVVTVFWSCLNASALLQTLVGHLLEWNKGNASAERLAAAFAFDKEAELFNSIGLAPHVFDDMYSHLEKLGWQIHDRVVALPASPESNECRIPGSSLTNSPPLLPSGHIVFNEVVFSYPSRPDIIFSNLNMEFFPGSTTFVLGHSGSGKSSLAGLLSKQYDSTAGEISIDGHEITLLSDLWIAKNVYICEQNPKLFDIPLRENIAIGSDHPCRVSLDEIDTALTDSCAEFVYEFPQSLHTSGCETLSGGQKQRISLARARIRDAPIMVFDEATSALDPHLRKEVFNNILSYRRGKTTILITHDIESIPQGYPVYVIANGEAHFHQSFSDKQKSELLKIDTYYQPQHESMLVNTTEKSLEKTQVIEIQNRRSECPQPNSLSSLQLLSMIPDKFVLVSGMIVSLAHACVNPVFSFVFSKLVMGILDPDSSRITMWAMLVMSLAITDGILAFSKVLLSISAEKWLKSVRVRLFGQLLSTPNPRMASQDASYYNKLLLSDTEKISEIITLYWPGTASMISLGLLGFVWAMAVGWKLTLVGISLLPVFVSANQLYKWLTKFWTAKRERRRSHVVRLMMDLTSEHGFRTLKVQHLEYYFKEFYLNREKRLQEMTQRMLYQLGAGYGVLKCFPYALQCLALWYGMQLLHSHGTTAQAMVTVFTLLMFTIVTIDQLTYVVSSVGNGFEALDRLVRALAITCNVTESINPPVGAISQGPTWEQVEFHRIGLTFSDGRSLLGNFSEKINKGETVAIIGPSGVGKSTIARFLERLESPTTGEIVIDQNWDLQTIDVHDVRQNVALVGQAPLDFFDGTIAENLLYALSSDTAGGLQRMIDTCEACGADEFISKLVDGYNTRMKAGMLSGGQMQRLGIARAMMRQPKVLIFDESTAALDADCKNLVKSMIVGLKERRNMIIILITHQMDVAYIADRIFTLS